MKVALPIVELLDETHELKNKYMYKTFFCKKKRKKTCQSNIPSSRDDFYIYLATLDTVVALFHVYKYNIKHVKSYTL